MARDVSRDVIAGPAGPAGYIIVLEKNHKTLTKFERNYTW